MKFQVLNNEQIGFYDDSGNLQAIIKPSGSNLIIDPVAGGNIELGQNNVVNDVEIGITSTPSNLTFLGGGTISANGNTLYLGDSAAGDNVIIDGVQVVTSYFSTGSLTLTENLSAVNVSASIGLSVGGNANIAGALVANSLSGDGSKITNLTIANSSFVVRDVNTPVRLYNPFQNALSNRYYDSILSNRLHGRQNVIYVSVDGSSPTLANDSRATWFNGDYEGSIGFSDTTHSIYLDFTSSGRFYNQITYPDGRFHVTFYNGLSWTSATLTPYYSGGPGTPSNFTLYDPVGNSYNAAYASIPPTNNLRAIQINFTGSCNINQIEYIGTRMTYDEAGFLSRNGGYVRILDPDIISLPTSDPKISGFAFTTSSAAIGAAAGFQVVCISQG